MENGYIVLHFFVWLLSLFPAYIVEKWSGNSDRWVGTDDRTEDKCEDESLDGFRSKEEHSKEDDEDGKRRENRTSHGIIDRIIDEYPEVFLFILRKAEIGTNTIHNDDRVIDWVPENRKHRGDEESIDFELREEIRSDDIHPKCTDDIMEEWCCSYGRKRETREPGDRSAECIGDIERDGEYNESEGHVSGLFDVISKRLSDINISSHRYLHWTHGGEFFADGIFELGLESFEVLVRNIRNPRESCLDDEFVFSGDFVNIDIIDHLRSIVNNFFFDSVYHITNSCRLNLTGSIIVFYLYPSRHIDTEIEWECEIGSDGHEDEQDGKSVVRKTDFDKIETHKYKKIRELKKE